MTLFIKNLFMNLQPLKDITRSLKNSTPITKFPDSMLELLTLTATPKLFNKWLNNVEKSTINLLDT